MREAIVIIALLALAFGAAAIAFVSLGNLYGNIKGALRWRYVRQRTGLEVEGFWTAVWGGFSILPNSPNTYWAFGGLAIPLDGRDKIRRQNRYLIL